MLPSISALHLNLALQSARAPRLVDVRRRHARLQSGIEIDADIIWLDPQHWLEWKDTLDRDVPLVFCCAHGQEISQGLTAALCAMGAAARYLEGGVAQWQAEGLPVRRLPLASSLWVTRERPKIDRIACPWLIARFIDTTAEFLYVPAADVLHVAQKTGATPYDVPDVELTHVGELCSFDALLARYGLDDPALQQMALIVRGADTSRLDLAPQAAGLYALSLGLSHTCANDLEMLRHGMVMYDALYAWCKSGQGETHHWPPTM